MDEGIGHEDEQQQEEEGWTEDGKRWPPWWRHARSSAAFVNRCLAVVMQLVLGERVEWKSDWFRSVVSVDRPFLGRCG